MSERLRIGDTVNEAFQFGLKRMGTVIRLGWAPILLAIFVMLGAAAVVFDFPTLMAGGEDMEIGALSDIMRVSAPLAVLIGIAAAIVVMIFFSGFMASIYRLVALGEDRPGFVHLRFDGPAMRVFWAQLIVAIINYGLFFIAFFIAAAMLGHAPGDVIAAVTKFYVEMMRSAGAGGEPDQQVMLEQMQIAGQAFSVIGLATAITLIPLFYINIKLAPFPPGSAAENRLVLLGSMNMTRGHFWSIFGSYVLFIVFMIILSMIFELVGLFLETLSGLAGAESGGLAIMGIVSGIIAVMLAVLFQAFTLGAQLSLRAIIYRRLKTGE